MKKTEKLTKYKGTLILTTIITLLPMLAGILLWNQLPEQIATHFDSNNVANGWSSRGLTVFGIPLFCLFVHFLCIGGTLADPKQKNVPDKVFKLIMLIAPFTSLFCGVSVYGYALNPGMNVGLIVQFFVGLIFACIGNYLPKCRQNYTIGIKLPWTLADEDNWNYTHRLAGRLWILCGMFMMVNAFLNISRVWIIFALSALMVVIPVGASLIYYLKHAK